MKGPAVFLTQFQRQHPPFDTLDNLAQWVSALGYCGIQVPVELIDLGLAAESDAYCDELHGRLAVHGLELTELSTHFQGRMMAVPAAYDELFDMFAPPAIRGNPAARQEWAEQRLRLAAAASRRLGLNASVTFSGSLLWHLVYPWPPRPAGLVEEGFAELGRRWRPILDAYDAAGVDVCYELHPGEDLHDGVTFERFLDSVSGHRRASILYDPSHLHLQHMDYLGFIDIYHERIKAFHVKDAEFQPSARSGVYGGYQAWIDRPGRFRSLGDGQIDFKGIFSRLVRHGYAGWAVMEWECCLKHPEDSAREGAQFIREHMIRRPEKSVSSYSLNTVDAPRNRRLLGLEPDTGN
ncbi:MAG: sugar phosphate isomerase/epimerase [Proteobacteria bacterium]|nr:sugar phosphate isomerase/epimerase [Pseudomonadota bacterium]HQR03087.1 sugar phosphate isomerase/epimerase [Rhodocyclaceae bacterium]